VKLAKVTRTRLVDRAVEAIYNQISSGELRAGEKLPGEIALSSQLGVGRPTVREALGQLIGLGLLERKSYGVTVAGGPSMAVAAKLAPMLLASWETRQLYEARMIIEGEIAVLACARATRKDIEDMSALNAQMNAKKDDPGSYWELDAAFHDLVSRTCGNEILRSMHASISDLFAKYEKSVGALEEIKSRTYAWHTEFIDALKKKDSARAKSVIQESLEASEAALTRLQMGER
jgi:GntR family transcriptional repressor for pyruvate dehydrogenase complex